MASNPTIPPLSDDWPTNIQISNPDGSTTQTNALPANRVSVGTILSAGGLGTAADNIDQIQLLSQINPASTAIGSSFYGINHRQVPPAIQINRDYYGLAFFTRPYLNLSTPNLQTHRLFTPLLTTDPNSLPRIIRCLLDFTAPLKGITTPFVDPQQAFISPLTNHLLSMSGWPDISVQTFTSHEGLYKEVFGFVDGNIAEAVQSYDLTATFRNLPGDPITTFFFYWCQYMAAVFEGSLVPYPDSIFNNVIDYNTRIYRLVLDSSKTKVQKIAACGAAFPLSDPMGAAFNFDSQSGPLNTSNDQITINFRCFGATYLDDILIDEFNRTVCLFNGGMVDSKRTSGYTKVPMSALTIFNNVGYARIDPTTYELEWWVDNNTYQQMLPVINQKNILQSYA
ncbi:MAG: hypothetical protein P4L77_10845 [Sulfuriferula sp.]|nr:hypothetical protein [Sulfuriferula sp.]